MSQTSRLTLSDVPLSLTVPEPLAERLRQLADRDCSSVAATMRRLIAVGVVRELGSEAVSLAESR